MPNPVLAAQALTKTYVAGDVSVHALRGLDLEISVGEVIVLLGPSVTHNAAIQDVAHRVLHFADGRISRTRTNETRRAAAALSW
jgi:putative ABC transport system ATP-binding protein